MVNTKSTQDEPIRLLDWAIAAIVMTISVLLVGLGIVTWLTSSAQGRAGAGEYASLYNIILFVAFGMGLPTGLACYGVFKGHPAGYAFLGLILLAIAAIFTWFVVLVLAVPVGLVAGYFLWRFVDILKSNYASSTR